MLVARLAADVHCRKTGRGDTASKSTDVLGFRLAGLAVLSQLVADLLAILKRTGKTERRDVNEYVWAATVRGNEAKALVLGEEFYGASCHLVLVGC